jgi:hypothetical protein
MYRFRIFVFQLAVLQLLCLNIWGQINYALIEKDSLLLSNDGDKGKPFSKDNLSYYLPGFEVDTNGDYFFLSGDKKTVLIMYNDSNELKRYSFSEFRPSRLYLFGDSIIVFDRQYDSNSLFIIDKKNGSIINKKKDVIKTRVNSYSFYLDRIILEIFDNKVSSIAKPEFRYLEVDFNGNIMGEIPHDYGMLLSKMTPPFHMSESWDSPRFLGFWREKMVFKIFDIETYNTVFLLYDPNSKESIFRQISQNHLFQFGQLFYDPWDELVKLRNETIYMVGHDTSNLIIVKISMSDLFDSID